MHVMPKWPLCHGSSAHTETLTAYSEKKWLKVFPAVAGSRVKCVGVLLKKKSSFLFFLFEMCRSTPDLLMINSNSACTLIFLSAYCTGGHACSLVSLYKVLAIRRGRQATYVRPPAFCMLPWVSSGRYPYTHRGLRADGAGVRCMAEWAGDLVGGRSRMSLGTTHTIVRCIEA